MLAVRYKPCKSKCYKYSKPAAVCAR